MLKLSSPALLTRTKALQNHQSATFFFFSVVKSTLQNTKSEHTGSLQRFIGNKSRAQLSSKNQNGFITMIVMLLFILVAVIGLVFYRVLKAN